jgi:hypothetical protein
MKKTLKMYVAPKAELIQMELQSSVLSSSTPETANFNGVGFQFEQKNGSWADGQ